MDRFSVSRIERTSPFDRHQSIVAPGKSVEGLRNPGSDGDREHPGAMVGNWKFKGSGTPQAAAVVAGAAALVLDHRPNLTPDQVKALLTDSARSIDGASSLCQGAGSLDLRGASRDSTPSAVQNAPELNGKGSLNAARGSAHVKIEGVARDGEVDVHGQPFNADQHAAATAQGLSWSAGTWNGPSWSGISWSHNSWSNVS